MSDRAAVMSIVTFTDLLRHMEEHLPTLGPCPNEKYFELELTPRPEIYKCILDRMETPVAEICMKEITKVLMEKFSKYLSKKFKYLGFNIKITNSTTVFVHSYAFQKSIEAVSWIKRLYIEGKFVNYDFRLIFYERKQWVCSCALYQFSKGEIVDSRSLNVSDLCYEIRKVDLEKDWILPKLKQGINPLSDSNFDEFCKNHILDFYSVSEYRDLVGQLLDYGLDGKSKYNQEYEVLKTEGKISKYFEVDPDLPELEN